MDVHLLQVRERLRGRVRAAAARGRGPAGGGTDGEVLWREHGQPAQAHRLHQQPARPVLLHQQPQGQPGLPGLL